MSGPAPSLPSRVVVVGFGPVAARLVEHLEPLVAAGLVALTIIGQEPDAAYNRVLVADLAVGRTREAAIRLADAPALRAAGIDVRLGARVVRVDRPFRRVLLDDGAAIDYDRLVLATGSRPVRPRLDGLETPAGREESDDALLPPGVSFLRDLSDARAVASALAARQRIVVLGGGILGIEAALAAAEEGGRVTLVHTGRSPMERLLGVGSRVLATALREAGITVVAGVSAGIDLEDGRFAGVRLEGGARVDGGALVLACGVRPRTELAEGCGLAVADGVLVDHTLRAVGTDDIWAIGDCAEVCCLRSSCTVCAGPTAPQGLIGPGWQQADELGAALVAELSGNGTGAGSALDGHIEPVGRREPVIVLKARGVDAVVAGETDADPWTVEPGLTVAEWADPGHGRYAKMVTRDGVLTGLVCVGMPRTGAELVLLFERGSELPADRSSLLRLDSAEGLLAASPPGPAATLCRCAGITRGTVQESVAAGCASVRDVSSSTRAGTGCGGCHEDIRAVIEEHFAAPVAS